MVRDAVTSWQAAYMLHSISIWKTSMYHNKMYKGNAFLEHIM